MTSAASSLQGYSEPLKQLSRRQFPPKRAAHQLRSDLIELLESGQLKPGDPFPTDDELASLTSLSRSTIRRALSGLASEGWIERKAGRGSFVSHPLSSGTQPPRQTAPSSSPPASGSASDVKRWRVGMLSFWDTIDDFCGSWYTSRILRGLSESSAGQSMAFEMMPAGDMSASGAIRAIEQAETDAIVSLSAYPQGFAGLAHAQIKGIPAVGVGTSYIDSDANVVAEDNMQGMQLALDQLLEAGHTRIGLVIQREPSPWVFERLESFENRMRELGHISTVAQVFWLPRNNIWMPTETIRQLATPQLRASFLSFVKDNNLTAVICCNLGSLCFVGEVVRDGGISIPKQLSIVTFDQVPNASLWLGGVQPHTVEIPLVEIGQRVGEVLVNLRQGSPERVVERIPCTLATGESIGAPNT